MSSNSRAGSLSLTPGDPLADLTRERRARGRDALAAGLEVDVLVVGGGVTGAGTALDAATRGLSVALVERHDLAHGTSRWSSKLVHGGLRYLARGDVSVAWESARERGYLMDTIAPHLVRPIAQLMPVMGDGSPLDALMIGSGLAAGDVLKHSARTRRGLLGRPRHLDADQAWALSPGLDRARLRSGFVNYEGQLEDDARLVVAIARTAAAYGARILTRVAALEVGPNGAIVEDTWEQGQFEIRARHVVNATGVWAGTLDKSVQLRPSRGTHVIVRAETLGFPQAALTVPVPGEFGRYVFALPQADGLVYIGLTDVPQDGPLPEVPMATSGEVAWILDILSNALAKPLTPADAVGTFAGLRPLVRPGSDPADTSGSSPGFAAVRSAGVSSAGVSSAGVRSAVEGVDIPSSDISRRHLVRDSGDGLITVTGGKLTTYRRMAQDVLDRITDVPCRTRSIPLVGAGPVSRSAASAPARLLRRYGSEAGLVASYADEHPELLLPLAPTVPVLGVELIHGLAREGALDLDDLLARRTRVALVPADLEAAAPRAEELLHHSDTGR